MKLTIASNGQQIKFFPGTVFRFTSNSPIFSYDGAFTFPFEIPIPENRLALGFAERLADTNANAHLQTRGKYQVYIESKHIPYTTGLLFVTPNNETYSCSLAIGEGQLFNSINEKLLSDLVDIPINMGSTVAQFISNANALVQQSFPDVDFNLPLMLAEKPYDNEAMIEQFMFLNFYKWFDASPSFVENDLLSEIDISGMPQTITVPTINNYNSFVPCPYVFSILNNIIKNIGFNPTGRPFSDKQTQQLMFITNKSIDQNPALILSDLVKVSNDTIHHIIQPVDYPSIFAFDKYSPAPLQNPIFSADSNGIIRILDDDNRYHFIRDENAVLQVHYKLIINNMWEDTLSIKLGIWFDYESTGLQVNPYITDNEFISFQPGETKTIEGSFLIPCIPGMGRIVLGARYDTTPSTPIYLRMMTNSLLDFIFISDQLSIKPKLSFNLRDNLPEITAKTLLDDLRNAFGIIPFVQGDDINLKFFKDIYASSPVLDLTPYLLYDYEKFETEKIKSFSFPNGFDNTEMTYDSDTGLAYSTITGKLVYFSELGHYYRNDHDEYYNFSYTRYLKDVNKIVVNDTGEEKQISADIPVMRMTNPSWATSGNWLPCPYIAGSLVSPFNDNDTINYMLAFWRGMVNDSSGDPYPFATPTVYKVGPSVLSGINTGLRFSGDYGTYEQYLSDFVAMLNQDLNGIKAEFDMPIGILKSLRLDSVYTIKNVKVIIKSIDYETDAKEQIKQPVTIELVKI